MRKCVWAIFLLLSCFSLQAGEAVPAWLDGQLPDRTILRHPGVYPLEDGKLLAVGQGKARASLRENHSIRYSLETAERDAAFRIAKYLFPEEFSKHKSVSVGIRFRQRVFEKPAQSLGEDSLVAIVVDSQNVIITPVLDASVIVDAKKVMLPPEMLFYLQDPPLQLGGGRIESFGDGWIAVAVGVAPLLGDDSPAERDAFKRARLEAEKILAETIFGGEFQVHEQGEESLSERNGIASFREWTQRTTRERIEGKLRDAVEVGHWYTDDDYIAVVFAVSDSPLDSFLSASPFRDDAQLDIPDYPDWEVEPDWEFVLLTHPRLLNGGALLYPSFSGMYAVGVGAGKLTGNMANDRINAPKAAEIDARRQILKYLSGFSVQSDARATEEIELVFAENGMESSTVIENLRKTTQEKIAGMVRNFRKVGMWKSMDRKLLYQVYVVDVGEPD